MTMRALEWLKESQCIYGDGGVYKTPINEAACDQLHPERMLPEHIQRAKTLKATVVNGKVTKWETDEPQPRPKLIKEWNCGVEDMRAIWLSGIFEDMDYVVNYHPDRPVHDRWVRGGRPIFPSCQECRLLMDNALHGAPTKYGQYLRYYRKGQYTANNFRVPNHGVRWTFDRKLVEQCPACLGAQSIPCKDGSEPVMVQCPSCQGRGYTNKGFQHHHEDELEQAWAALQDAERYMADHDTIIKLHRKYDELREQAEVQALASEFEILEGPGGYTARRRRASR